MLVLVATVVQTDVLDKPELLGQSNRFTHPSNQRTGLKWETGCSVLTADESAAVYIASAWLSRLLSRLRLPACLLLVDTPALTTSTLANRSNTYKQLLNFLLITDAMDFAFDSAQLCTYDLIMPINVRTSIPIFFLIVIIHDKRIYSFFLWLSIFLSIFISSSCQDGGSARGWPRPCSQGRPRTSSSTPSLSTTGRGWSRR